MSALLEECACEQTQVRRSLGEASYEIAVPLVAVGDVDAHPLALAGVYDHSNFRDDLVGRLRRTTAFVAGTTYAPSAEVEALIAKVTRIHAQVRGHTADGRAYSADDPALLTWVLLALA